MAIFVNQPQKLLQILLKSIRYHIPVYKKIFLLIIAMVIVKDIWNYLGIPEEGYWRLFIIIPTIVILIYLWAVSFAATERVLHHKSIHWQSLFSEQGKKLIPILITLIVYALIYGVALGIYFLIVYLAGPTSSVRQYLPFVGMVIGLIMIFVYLLSFFTLPLIALEKNIFVSAFSESALLVRDQWFRVLVVFCVLMVIGILIYPNTLFGQLIKSLYLTAPFDFLVLSIIIPVMNIFILLFLHDLRLRRSAA